MPQTNCILFDMNPLQEILFSALWCYSLVCLWYLNSQRPQRLFFSHRPYCVHPQGFHCTPSSWLIYVTGLASSRSRNESGRSPRSSKIGGHFDVCFPVILWKVSGVNTWKLNSFSHHINSDLRCSSPHKLSHDTSCNYFNLFSSLSQINFLLEYSGLACTFI